MEYFIDVEDSLESKTTFRYPGLDGSSEDMVLGARALLEFDTDYSFLFPEDDLQTANDYLEQNTRYETFKIEDYKSLLDYQRVCWIIQKSSSMLDDIFSIHSLFENKESNANYSIVSIYMKRQSGFHFKTTRYFRNFTKGRYTSRADLGDEKNYMSIEICTPNNHKTKKYKKRNQYLYIQDMLDALEYDYNILNRLYEVCGMKVEDFSHRVRSGEKPFDILKKIKIKKEVKQ